MGLLECDPPKKYLELIEQFRLIDDTFFDICFDGSTACMQLLLRIFFARDDIIVKEVITQRSAHNLYGRSARFDVIAVDSTGKIYNVEIQRADEGANPKRVRFNHSLIDSREINKGTKYKDFPEVWVIFITENDIFGREFPMYHIDHIVRELNQPFDDAAHTMYVNGAYRGTDALGLLMQDFFCHVPARMHYPELAERADFFKHKKEGVNTMCKIMQTLQEEGRAEGLAAGRAEGLTVGRNEMATDTAMKMLRFNEPIEKIVTYTNLSPERISELAKQIR